MSKPRLDIMVDIETLGTTFTSTVIQVSAIGFDIETGEEKYYFDECANISKNSKLNVEAGTLKWWLKTNPDLLQDIISRQDQSSQDVMTKFYNFLVELKKKYNIYLWGNGIGFDNMIIKTQIQYLGAEYPIMYRNDRDVRTILDLASKKLGVSEKEFRERYKDDKLVMHDAFDDCRFQIAYVVGAYNILIK